MLAVPRLLGLKFTLKVVFVNKEFVPVSLEIEESLFLDLSLEETLLCIGISMSLP